MNSGDQNYKEACSRYENGELGEAIKLFTKAIEYYSKSKEDEKEIKAYYYRGCSYYRLGIQCEKNQMFEDSEENFEKAIIDFKEVSKKISESYPQKIREIKEKFDDVLVNFYVFYTEIDKTRNNEEKFYNALMESIEFYELFKEEYKHKEIKEKFHHTRIKYYECCEEIDKNIKIKEKFDNILKDIEELSLKIDDLHSFNYYAGCTCYKLGMLYEKKRMSDKAHENFKNASTYLDITSKYGPYKENGKLWFYKSIANYKLDKYEDSFEDFKKAVTYDYYNMKIFEKLLLKIDAGNKNGSKRVPLLYYLKRYSDIISEYSDNPSYKYCWTNLIEECGYEGAYYCALSHYEFKDFKRSFEIFDKFTENNNDGSYEKFNPISWYYKGLILRELKNVCKTEEIINLFFKKDTSFSEEEKKEFNQIIADDSRISDYYRSNPEKRKKFLNFIFSDCSDGSDRLSKGLEYLEKCISVEAEEDHLNENYVSVWYFKAKIYEKQGEKFKAKKAYQKVIDIESTRSFEESLNIYDKITNDSQNSCLSYDKALVLDELKRHKEAIEALDEFLKNKPRDAKAWLKKGTILFKIAIDEEIKTASEEPKTENKDEKSPCEKEITKIDAAKKALEKSIRYFKILIDENPHNPDHWYNRGTAHSSLAEVLIKIRKYQDAIDEYEKAVTAFETATTLNPIFALAWNNKGNAYLKLKKYNKAIDAFEEAFEINPNYYLALHNKGDALYSLGKYEEAINIYDQVISTENDPNVYKSWNDRGLAKYRLENYEEALEAFDKAIEINPTFADGLINKGVVFYKLEMPSKAKEVFEKALELEPGNSRASNNLGVVLARDGELDRAKKLFENIIQEDPDFILANANLAELLLNSGGVEEASRKIESISKDDKNPDSNIGYIHFLNGRIKIEDMEIKEKKYSDAAKSFEKAASSNLDNPIFLIWSVYAKYLCQKFETGEKANSSEKANSGEENISTKTEDICSSEISNSIICDLGKVLNFCNTAKIKNNSLSRLLNQNLLWEIVSTIIILYGLFYLFDILKLDIQNVPHIQKPNYLYLIAIELILLVILFDNKLRWPIIAIITMILLFGPYPLSGQILSFVLLIATLLIILLKLFDRRSLQLTVLTILSTIAIIVTTITIVFFNFSLFGLLFTLLFALLFAHLIPVMIIILKVLHWINELVGYSKESTLGIQIKIREYLINFNRYKEIKAYTLYLLGYFYFKLQDYTTAKEKLQECISLRPDPRTDKAARDLLDNIWKQKIKPPFWTYWFNSPVNTWRRRASGTFAIFGIFLILFVHVESPQPVAWKEYKLNDSGNFTPDQINIYPYVISYNPSNNTTSNLAASEISNGDATESILTPASMDIYLHYPTNNTTSNLTGSLSNNNNTNNENDSNKSNNNTTLKVLTPASVNIYLYYLANNTTSTPAGSENSNNNTTFNILTPASVDIYPKIPDNYFDDILLLIFILILISPSVRIAEAITEAIKIVLKKGVGDVSLDLGPIVAPPEFNFELSPSLMLDVIKRLDENL
jgi:tetratricopeptide (TPR) repeat protein